MNYLKLKKLVAVIFFLCVFISFLSPITDADFPWHLKTGEYVYQHGEIPKTDPFSLISTGDIRERFILSCYWLGQLIFYGIYNLIGPLGIVMLRSLLFTGIIVILWSAMKNTPLLLKIGALYITAMLFSVYLGDRPQLFSFFFAIAVIALLENYKKTSSKKYLIFLPLLMLFWANVHGGFIFGIVVIAIFCLSETVKHFFLKKSIVSLDKERLLLLVAIGFISIIASYINPNTYQAITLTIEAQGDPLFKVIKEYFSPYDETRGPFASRYNFIYWSIMGYSLVLLALNLRRLDLTHLGLIFFTLYISLSAIRFVPFFVMTGLFISAQYRVNIINPDRHAIFNKLKLPVTILSLFLVLLWCGSLVHSMPRISSLNRIPETRLYPEGAVRFLLKNIDGGRIFCSYNTGSYLLWRLYPRFRTFIDTRGINYKAAYEADAISHAERWEGDGNSFVDALNTIMPVDAGSIEIDYSGKRTAAPLEKERWINLLDKYGIDIIVHEASNFYTGRILPLIVRLIKDNHWRLVYSDGRALIFVRDTPGFRELISQYEIAKEKIYDQIGIENSVMLGRQHSHIYSSLAFALLMKGGSDETAETYIKHALSLNQKDLLASYLEAFLKIKKAERASSGE